MQQLSCDICIIGAGPAGLTVASASSQLGRDAILIERGKMGGDCLNYGCVPSKALIAAARHAYLLRTAGAFGISCAGPRVDFRKVMAHVRDVISSIAPDDSQDRFEKLGCRVLRSPARFVDRETVLAGEYRIKARRFVIAAGSSPYVPPIAGLAEVSYFTSDTIFDNETLPAHLLVVGAGAVGLELAQAFSRLGSQVTVLEALRPLPGSDPELTEIVLDACRREHIEIIAPCRIMSARKSPEGLTLSIETSGSVRELAASHLLIAAGRRPNLEGLGLETAGIAASARGIELTKGLKTSNPLVYAIGDVAAGDLNFTHVAAHQAGLVIKNALFRLPVTYDPAKMPWVIYTDPEFAHAGLSEVEAKDRGLDVNVLHWPLSRTDRARIERRTDGLLKIVLDRKGRVLGAGIVGLNAGELILPWCRMIEGGEKIRRMAESVIPYPTLSEASRRVALTKFQTLGSNAWVRRAIDVLTSIG